MRSRRIFLTGLVLLGATARLAGSRRTDQQTDERLPQAQERKQGQAPTPENPSLPNPEKKILEDNDKDMKKKVERLYELALKLKTEVEKTDSSKVLSVDLMRKAEEIEKLARDIKNRSKG